MPSQQIGRVVRRLRSAKGWTQRALAERAGVTDAYIAMLETGVRQNPSLRLLRRLAKALGVPAAELLG